MSAPDDHTARAYLKPWYGLFLTWQIIHWFLLLLLTGGSAAVASRYTHWMSDQLSLFVAIVGAIYAAFNPSQRAEAYREAWLILNREVLLGSPAEKVVGAYLLGEEIIGRKPKIG